MVEYTDPNPFKEFHIGHLMTNTIGESLARIHEAHAARTSLRVNYQGDVGLHVAKSVWGMMQMDEMPGEDAPVKERAAFLGRAYARGAGVRRPGGEGGDRPHQQGHLRPRRRRGGRAL